MSTNMGTAHRLTYAIGSVGAIAYSFFSSLSQPWPILMALLGMVLLVEAVSGF